MAIPSYLKSIVEEQHQHTVDLDTSEIISAAKSIAFYCAMLDAQQDDPFMDAGDNDEMEQFLNARLTTYVEAYQVLVNNEL